MSKKKSSPGKNSSKKRTNGKKQVQTKSNNTRKLWIGIAALLLIALTVTIILVCCSGPEIDWDMAEANLKKAGYTMGSYVPELSGYKGVVKSMSASYSESSSDSLSDYVNSEKEVINFVRFNNEENAKQAYEIFCQKWTDKFDEYGIVGDTVYFGTSDAFDIATEIEEQ